MSYMIVIHQNNCQGYIETNNDGSNITIQEQPSKATRFTSIDEATRLLDPIETNLKLNFYDINFKLEVTEH